MNCKSNKIGTLLFVLYKTPITESSTFKSFLNNCEEYHNSIRVIIWDNSPIPQDTKLLSTLPIETEYVSTPENLALSKIYNKIIQKCHSDKFIYLFDQDSYLTNDYFYQIENNSTKYDSISLFIPIIRLEDKIFSPCKEYYNKSILFNTITPGIISSKHIRFILSGIALVPSKIGDLCFDEKLKFYWIDNKFAYDYSKKYRKLCVIDYILQHDLSLAKPELPSIKFRRLKSNVCGALYTSSKMSFLAFLNTSFFIIGYTIKQLLKVIKT